jgi:hypothetical protein
MLFCLFRFSVDGSPAVQLSREDTFFSNYCLCSNYLYNFCTFYWRARVAGHSSGHSLLCLCLNSNPQYCHGKRAQPTWPWPPVPQNSHHTTQSSNLATNPSNLATQPSNFFHLSLSNLATYPSPTSPNIPLQLSHPSLSN